jgi:hypothetical protein
MSALLPFIRLTAFLPFDEISSHCDACERRADFVRDYAHGVGFRVGSGGEWIAEDRVDAFAPEEAA